MEINRYRKPSRIVKERRKDTRKSASKRGYGRRWEAYTARFLGKTGGSRRPCIACVDTLADSYVVDHIIPINQANEKLPMGARDEVFWPAWNHQPLCVAHHKMKSVTCDDWYRQNRGSLLRQIEHLLTDGADVHDVRDFLIRSRNMWPLGWFDLNPDPDHYMTILTPGTA